MKYVVMTCTILHQRTLLDHTELSKSTKLYQRSQEILLDSKDIMRFLCMVTRPHVRVWMEEKIRRERSKHTRDEERPTMERVLMLFLNPRPW